MAAIIDRHFESGIVHVQSPQKSGSASLPRAMKSGNLTNRMEQLPVQPRLGAQAKQNGA